MTKRKKKIRLIQAILFLVAISVVVNTYFLDDKTKNEKIITSENIKNLKSSPNLSDTNDIFYNIEYSGLDLSGNRYVLKSKQARTRRDSQEIVYMESVEGIFYFKDNTSLLIYSDNGIYNNNSLDMIFKKNVVANYEGSELKGEKIEYLNSKKLLIVSENVKLDDLKGSISADKLLFDLEKKTLDIKSFEEKVNANINLK